MKTLFFPPLLILSCCVLPALAGHQECLEATLRISNGANQTRLQLFALAYNLANFLRRLALTRDVKHWSLTTLREKLVKIGAKVTRHAKYVTFQLAEVAITRKLFAAILDRIERLALPPPVVARCSE